MWKIHGGPGTTGTIRFDGLTGSLTLVGKLGRGKAICIHGPIIQRPKG